MKKPRWLRWRSEEKSSASKFDNLKKARRQTDQRMKQQGAQKERQDAAEKNKPEKKKPS